MKIGDLLSRAALAPAVAVAVHAPAAMAATTGGGTPLATWLTNYTGLIDGPVAFAGGVSMIAGGAYQWHRRGHELHHGIDTILVLGILVTVIGGIATWYQYWAQGGALI
jgi:type IV secretory pathway VirB2 component (pilin)